MLLVGWPILTAISTLFWSVVVSDAASDADMAADRIIVRMPGLIKYRILEDRPVILKRGFRDCAVESSFLGQKDRQRDSSVLEVDIALHAFRNDLDVHDAYLLEIAALQSLPLPVLGALDGCISGSLLAPYCEDRAQAIVQKALDSNRAALKHKFSKNAGLAAEMFCIAVDGMNRSGPIPDRNSRP